MHLTWAKIIFHLFDQYIALMPNCHALNLVDPRTSWKCYVDSNYIFSRLKGRDPNYIVKDQSPLGASRRKTTTNVHANR